MRQSILPGIEIDLEADGHGTNVASARTVNRSRSGGHKTARGNRADAEAPISLDEHLEAFLKHLSSYRRCSSLTVRAYASDARQFLAWCGSRGMQLVPEILTRAVLLDYFAGLGTLRPNSIRRKTHALSAWFKHLVERRVVEANPCEGLVLPHRERRTPRFPSAEECEALVRTARKPVEEAAIWLLLTAGLRRAELIGLDLEDLSLERGELRVFGKGRKERTVPLPQQTQAVLQHYLETRGTQAGPLLLSRVDTRLGVTCLNRLLQRLLHRAALEDAGYSLHSLRHSYATLLLRAGVDLATIRDLLGHGDISITSAYVHSDVRSRREAIERLPVATAPRMQERSQDELKRVAKTDV
jgi:site-specific recombinase XerD